MNWQSLCDWCDRVQHYCRKKSHCLTNRLHIKDAVVLRPSKMSTMTMDKCACPTNHLHVKDAVLCDQLQCSPWRCTNVPAQPTIVSIKMRFRSASPNGGLNKYQPNQPSSHQICGLCHPFKCPAKLWEKEPAKPIIFHQRCYPFSTIKCQLEVLPIVQHDYASMCLPNRRGCEIRKVTVQSLYSWFISLRATC